MQNIKKSPLVSISIATLNSAETISKALDSVKNQTYKNIEILIGDGGSRDDTIKIAKKYSSIICYGKEIGRARYAILQKAKGKYIMILDSDQYMGKMLIERAVKKMESGNYDALIFSEESVIDKNSTLIERLIAYDKWVVVSSKDADPVSGAEFPRVFKRTDLLKFKWQKSLSILDDQIFVQENLSKLRNIIHLGGDGLKHKEVDSFSVFFRKFMRYGRLYTPTFNVSKKITLAHSLPRRYYFKWRVIKKPNVFFGLMLLYFLKSLAVTSGIISYKLKGK